MRRSEKEILCLWCKRIYLHRLTSYEGKDQNTRKKTKQIASESLVLRKFQPKPKEETYVHLRSLP